MSGSNRADYVETIASNAALSLFPKDFVTHSHYLKFLCFKITVLLSNAYKIAIW